MNQLHLDRSILGRNLLQHGFQGVLFPSEKRNSQMLRLAIKRNAFQAVFLGKQCSHVDGDYKIMLFLFLEFVVIYFIEQLFCLVQDFLPLSSYVSSIFINLEVCFI